MTKTIESNETKELDAPFYVGHPKAHSRLVSAGWVHRAGPPEMYTDPETKAWYAPWGALSLWQQRGGKYGGEG